METKTGICLIFHGSPKSEANLFAEKIVESLAVSPHIFVQIGFLEFGGPRIPQALETLTNKQCTTIKVLPLFLAPGKHVSEDIPHLIEDFKKNHPHVQISLEKFLGAQDGFLSLLRQLINDL